MARTRRKKLIIDDPGQQAVLASPVRMEVMEHLCVIGPAPVREIAARMERTSHAIHYHVRKLVQAGFVEQTGSRKSGPRDEALYDVAAETYEVSIDSNEPIENRAELRVIRAALRRAERDYADLAASDPQRLSTGDVFAGRMRTRLSAGARRDVMTHMRAIQRIFAEELRREHPPQAKLETFTLTAVLLPDPS